MRKPLIIGLPGAGKSEINELLSQRLDIDIISTDTEFRRLRAVPVNDNTNQSEVVRLFLRQIETDFVETSKMTLEKYQALCAACHADPDDALGRSFFRDSTVARSFGEDVFRTFEWVMNGWLHRYGYFKDKLVDISSSAALYAQNREIFSEENGYVPILLNANHDAIVANLVAGFRKHQALSGIKGELVPIRGAYEKVARDAIADAGKDTDEVVRAALSDYAAKHRSERLDHFNAMASAVVDVTTRSNPARIVRGIMNVLEIR